MARLGMRLVATWSGMSLLALALVSPAAAQRTGQASAAPAAPAADAYGALIDQGLAEYDAHNFLEARSLFLRAHEMQPNARTLRVLGMTEFELRNYPASIEYLQQALASQVKPLSADLRAQVEDLLQRAEGFVARVRVDVKPTTAKPQLLIDGAVSQTAVGAPLVLQVGEHTVEARAEGYRSETRTLNVKGGEDQALSLSLGREMFAAEPEKSTPLYKSPWLWTGVGVAAVGVGVLLAVLLQPADKVVVGAPVTTAQTPGGVKIQAHGSF